VKRSTFLFAFVDYLFFLVINILFILSLASMSVKKPDANVLERAEFVITLEWNDDANADVDLWMADPKGGIVYYNNRQKNFMTLDRDDLGHSTDTTLVDGEKQVIAINREVITIRGVLPGEYIINAYLYGRFDTGPLNVKVNVTKLQPFAQVYRGTVIMNDIGEERTMVRFIMDEKGVVTGVNTLPEETLVRRER
jgi:uncharacterized protein YfaP (DUF2135 family)